MIAKFNLAQQLHGSGMKLGAQLAAKKKAHIEAHRKAEEGKIEQQIKEAPIIADRLIKGLPSFLQEVAEAEYSRAYVLCRSGCQPCEHYFPNYLSESRRSQSSDGNMTEYAIRRYMKGTIQRVALWGLKQGLIVGVGYIKDSRDLEHWQRHHRGVLPVYMPGMFYDYVPTGLNADLLYFDW